jgi:hypothetical protein
MLGDALAAGFAKVELHAMDFPRCVRNCAAERPLYLVIQRQVKLLVESSMLPGLVPHDVAVA